MYTAEMLESIKKVETTRAQRLGVEPRRMTAEEKDELLRRVRRPELTIQAGYLRRPARKPANKK